MAPVSVHPKGGGAVAAEDRGVLLAGLSRCPLRAAGHCQEVPPAPSHPHLSGRRVLSVGGMHPTSIPEAFPELQQKPPADINSKDISGNKQVSATD